MAILPQSSDQPDQSKQDKQLELASLLLRSIAHPDRVRILLHLGRYGQMNVTGLCQLLKISQPPLSHHLVKMADRGVLQRHRKGKEIYYSLVDPELIRVLEGFLAL